MSNKIKSFLLVGLITVFTLSGNTLNIWAEEAPNHSLDKVSERGATDYYYTPISYSITNKRNRAYSRTMKATITVPVGIYVNGMFISFGTITEGRTYNIYTYTADVTVTARKTDAMGHDLGVVTFSNPNIQLEDYVLVY